MNDPDQGGAGSRKKESERRSVAIEKDLEEKLRWAFQESRKLKWDQHIPDVDIKLQLSVRLFAMKLPNFWDKEIEEVLLVFENNEVLQDSFRQASKVQIAFTMRLAIM